MKKSGFLKNSDSRSNKGFYLALFLSVAAIGLVSYLTLNRLNESIGSIPDGNFTAENSSSVEEASKPQSGIPKDDVEESKVESDASDNSQQETGGIAENQSAEETNTTSEMVSEPVEETKAEAQKSQNYIIPLEGTISNVFSNGELVKSKTLGDWRTHDGIDILAAEGTPVKSVFDGTVTDVREDRQWGIVVEIEYPAGTFVYAGLSTDVPVKIGQAVALGDVIGYVGNTSVVESAEEYHLHLGLRVNGEWADPFTVLPAQSE